MKIEIDQRKTDVLAFYLAISISVSLLFSAFMDRYGIGIPMMYLIEKIPLTIFLYVLSVFFIALLNGWIKIRRS